LPVVAQMLIQGRVEGSEVGAGHLPLIVPAYGRARDRRVQRPSPVFGQVLAEGGPQGRGPLLAIVLLNTVAPRIEERRDRALLGQAEAADLEPDRDRGQNQVGCQQPHLARVVTGNGLLRHADGHPEGLVPTRRAVDGLRRLQCVRKFPHDVRRTQGVLTGGVPHRVPANSRGGKLDPARVQR
jgi:hypothetical protein